MCVCTDLNRCTVHLLRYFNCLAQPTRRDVYVYRHGSCNLSVVTLGRYIILTIIHCLLQDVHCVQSKRTHTVALFPGHTPLVWGGG